MGTTRDFQLLEGLVIGATRGLVQLKDRLTHGLGTWSDWLAPRGPVAPKKGM